MTGVLFAPISTYKPIGVPASLGATGNDALGAVASFSHTTTAAIVAGDLVVIGVLVGSNYSVTVASVSDGTNSYTKLDTTGIFTATEVSLWYKENASAVASSATITATFSVATTGASNYSAIAVARVTGIAASSSADKFQHASGGTVASVTATTAALTQAKQMAFGTAAYFNGSHVVYNGASGFTNIVAGSSTTNVRVELDYQGTLFSTGAVSYVPTFASSVTRLGGVVGTFKGF